MDEKINEEEVKEVIPEYILSCAGTFTEKESNDLAKYLAGKTKVKYLVITTSVRSLTWRVEDLSILEDLDSLRQ